MDERSPSSASGLLGKVCVTTALLDDRQAAPAWMCHLTAQLGWCWHCIEYTENAAFFLNYRIQDHCYPSPEKQNPPPSLSLYVLTYRNHEALEDTQP